MNFKLKFIIKNAMFYKKIKNYSRMVFLYKLAIKKYNCSNSMYALGEYYYSINNKVKMNKYFLLAIKNKNSDALYKYGLIKYSINNKNKKYLKMSVNSGNINSMLFLASISEYTDKILYYLMAIKAGSVEAMYNLGVMFDSYKDKTNNIVSYKVVNNMIKFYKMAIEKNHIGAMIKLGLYYKQINNIEGMIYYLKMAINNGNSIIAIRYMAEYAKENNDILNAINYYKMGIKLDDYDSMYNLCKIYENGGDIYSAKRCYKKLLQYIEIQTDDQENINYDTLSYVHHFMGQYYMNKNKTIKMVEHFNRSLDLNPDSDSIYNLQCYYLKNDNINEYLKLIRNYQSYYIDNYIYDLDIFYEVFDFDKYVKLFLIIDIKKHFYKIYCFYKNDKFHVLYGILIYIFDKYFNKVHYHNKILYAIITKDYKLHQKHINNIYTYLYKLYKNKSKVNYLFTQALNN